VWWDRKIKAGQAFDEVIERELETAKHIVVLWSDASVTSEWVKNEAAVAVQRGVLVPVLLDNVKTPLEFRRKQTADLIAWDGDPSHGGLQALFEALDGAEPQARSSPSSTVSPSRPTLQFRPLMVTGGAGFVLGCLITYLVVTGSADPAKTASRASAVAATGASGVPLVPKRQDTNSSLLSDLQTSDKGVFLDVVGFERAGELTTVEWIVRNTSDARTGFCSHASRASLIDQISGESWPSLHNGGPAAGCETLPPGAQSVAWAKFKVPGLESRRLALSLPTLLKAPELPKPKVGPK
jgi:hypothetical protein